MPVDSGQDIITACLLEEGIIQNTIKDKSYVRVSDVKKVKDLNQKLSDNQPYCVLIRTGKTSSVTQEARRLVASKEFVKTTIAKAIVVEGAWSRIIANLYLRVNKPNMTTKIFEKPEDAIDWLRIEYKNFKL
ncbi:MAG: hypothetical protein MI810_18660 [Flavobacteriales bacterium]|nr:hypothetical protein [Flavobacteriales bacterium]